MDIYLTLEELGLNRKSVTEDRGDFKKPVKNQDGDKDAAQKSTNREYKTVLCKRTSDYKEKADDGNPKCD